MRDNSINVARLQPEPRTRNMSSGIVAGEQTQVPVGGQQHEAPAGFLVVTVTALLSLSFESKACRWSAQQLHQS
jgi:hypothetical protein